MGADKFRMHWHILNVKERIKWQNFVQSVEGC